MNDKKINAALDIILDSKPVESVESVETTKDTDVKLIRTTNEVVELADKKLIIEDGRQLLR